MVDQNFPDNILYEMDNLDVLRGMNSETVDLIATDPPFNTKRNRSGTAGFYVDNWRWGDTGILPDQWKWNEVHPVWLEEIKDENQVLFEVIEAAGACHGQDIAAFLCFLSVRLLEMRRVLKPTGSIYLHCDHTANSYIRMVMDAIFGHRNFRNEIVWFYKTGGTSKRWFSRKHDTILFYAKSREYAFIPQKEKSYLAHKYGFSNIEINQDEQGFYTMVGMRDVWDIPALRGNQPENTGSPDQKPLAVYERIIMASSNPGDLVLDPFDGCATTIMAARKHGRRWVGIDRRKDARYHAVCRMASITPGERKKLEQRLDLQDWLATQLERYETHWTAAAPERTDIGETAAPPLPGVYLSNERSKLSHAQMHSMLWEKFGCQCWACDFVAPWPEYLELDHVNPKSDGGSNHLDNRALLCRPCNGKKDNRITLSKLRTDNRKDGRLTGADSVNLRHAATWARGELARMGT